MIFRHGVETSHPLGPVAGVGTLVYVCKVGLRRLHREQEPTQVGLANVDRHFSAVNPTPLFVKEPILSANLRGFVMPLFQIRFDVGTPT